MSRTVREYALALAVTAAAIGLRYLADPWLGDRLSLVTLYGAVAISVWYGGYRPAILTTVAGYLAVNILFMPPRGVLSHLDATDTLGLIAYALSCGAIIALGQGMRTARARLQAEQGLLERVVRSIDDYFVMLDPDWRYVYVNNRMLELGGRAREELIGSSIWEVFPGLVGTEFETAALAAMAEQRPVRIEFFYPARQNWLEVQFYPSPVGVTLLSRNVTPQHVVEASLAKRVTELGALYELSDQLQHSSSTAQICDAAFEAMRVALDAKRASILLFDPDGVMRFVAWRGLSDEYRSAVDGHSPWKAGERDASPIWVDDVTTADMEPWLRERVESEGIRSLGFVPLVAGGTLIGKFMVYHSAPHPRQQAEVDVAQTIARQLAFALQRQRTEQERLNAVEALATSEERFRLATNAGKVGVWDWDVQANRVSWSDSLFPIQGTAPEDFRGTVEYFMSLVYPEDRPLVSTAIERALRDDVRYSVEFRAIRPDGEVIWLFTDAEVLRRNGKPYRMIGAVVDVTHRKRSEAELREAHRRKDEFLATLAHELRNPLSPIVNSLALLKRTDDPAVRATSSEMIERQVGHLVRLVDDLLDVGRVTHDRLELRRENIDLATVIQHAVDTCAPLADRMKHQVVVKLPDTPLMLNADPVRLTQVLGNLINNACKYSPLGGKIEVEATRHGDEARISVSDEGIGIPAAMLPHVFDLFVQVESSLTRSSGGLGIGLTLVRRLVEMHGGRVEAFSAGPDQGSQFVVHLPLIADTAERTSEKFAGSAKREG